MTECNVDVMDKTGKVLHTYPITLGATMTPSPRDADYEKAALGAARVAKLVPNLILPASRHGCTRSQKPPRDLNELSKEKTSSQTGSSY